MKGISEYYPILRGELNSWLEVLILKLPNALIALFIVFYFIILGVVLDTVTSKLISRHRIEKFMDHLYKN